MKGFMHATSSVKDINNSSGKLIGKTSNNMYVKLTSNYFSNHSEASSSSQ